ncbi:MAG: DUF1573 domain-containing protein [Bacteroidales bacterium]|nr:DUF1573 domain-containing protein [Bacteroidales bacterium]
MKKLAVITITLLCSAFLVGLRAQGSKAGNTYGGIVRFDKTVHDFGDILVSDGPVSATFTAENVSGSNMVIYNVVSSCGCTDVTWTREPVKPGESGKVKATYKNDEGGYPFDKTLTVYVSGLKQPVILRLRGESHAKKLALKELYPVRFGNLAFKSADIKGGNMSQGQQKSGEILVANLGKKPIDVKFKDVSPGLSLKLSQNPVPAGGTAKLAYTVTSDRNHWGKNYYYATPLVDGVSYKAVVSQTQDPKKEAGTEALLADPNPLLGAGKPSIGIFTITKEDFSSWTKAQRDAASNPVANESTFSFGKVKSGAKVNASFVISNKGKSALKVYKVDSESSKLKPSAFPDLAPGGKYNFKCTLDTSGLPKGECLIVVTLTTNSPLRPIVNLFVTGWIE